MQLRVNFGLAVAAALVAFMLVFGFAALDTQAQQSPCNPAVQTCT